MSTVYKAGLKEANYFYENIANKNLIKNLITSSERRALTGKPTNMISRVRIQLSSNVLTFMCF